MEENANKHGHIAGCQVKRLRTPFHKKDSRWQIAGTSEAEG